MSNMLANGADFLARQLKSHAAGTVSLSDGTYSVSLSATVGRTELQLQDASGNVIEWKSVDFIITAADLILNSAKVQPKRGWRITRPVGSGSEVYEVQSPGNEQPWRWVDQSQVIMRIHTARTA
jgi:hypothetical protein